MLKKSLLLIIVLAVMFMNMGCTYFKKAEKVSYIKLIVVANEKLSINKVKEKITETLISKDKNINVDKIEISEEDKYLITISTKLTEDEAVSLLKSEKWIKVAEINFDVKIN